MATLVITKIDDQGDRVLFYGHPKWPDYHVIAPAGTCAKIGDKVEYQPEGYNFGKLVCFNLIKDSEMKKDTSIPAAIKFAKDAADEDGYILEGFSMTRLVRG